MLPWGRPERAFGSERRRVERMLTVAELAVRLGTSAPTVYRLAKLGRIPCVRVGRQLRFDEATVMDALAEKPKAAVG